MKKSIVGLVCILAIALFVIGFAENCTVASAADEKHVTFASGGVGGSWYILNAAVNDIWQRNIPGLYVTLIPGGGSSNPTVVNSGKAMFGMTYAGDAMGAYKGGKHEKVLGFTSLNMKQYLTILITKDSGITSFADILEKRPVLNCSIGPRGSGSAQMFERAFAAYGISMKDIASWGGRVEYTSPQDGGNGIRDGQLNVLSGSSPLRNPYMIEASNARDLIVLPMDEAQVKSLASYGYEAGYIPKGTYKGTDVDSLTVTDVTCMIVNADFDEETAYKMAKVMCENKEQLVQAHYMWGEFDPKMAPKLPVPIHPGAKKYYDEMGY